MIMPWVKGKFPFSYQMKALKTACLRLHKLSWFYLVDRFIVSAFDWAVNILWEQSSNLDKPREEKDRAIISLWKPNLICHFFTVCLRLAICFFRLSMLCDRVTMNIDKWLYSICEPMSDYDKVNITAMTVLYKGMSILEWWAETSNEWNKSD